MRLVALCTLLAAKLLAADPSTFAYDRDLALDVREHEVAIRNGIRVALLNFQVKPAVRVDAVLVTPHPGKTKTGGVIWVHSGGFFEQMSDAMLLAQASAVSLLINPILPNWSAPPETWREAMVRAVVSVRRGIDLLLGRNDIDPNALDSSVTVTAH